MKSVAVDTDRLDREARELFGQLTPAPTVGQDKDGRTITITPSERLIEIVRRSRLIAVSDTLARSVAALLSQHGITAEVGHVQVDPAGEGDEQVLGLLVDLDGTRAVVPIRPGATRLRAYPETEAIDLTGSDPLLVIDLPDDTAESDGWVTATAIHTALARHLTAAT